VAVTLTAAGAVLSSLWPTAAVVVGAVLLILVLCIRFPACAFLAALVLYSFEGSIKMRLSVEEAPSPLGFGAASLDFAFLASLAALLGQDRGRSLIRVWTRATRWERVAVGLFAAWLCLSVVQVPWGGDLIDGLEGFRLTQLYFLALLGGIVVASRLGASRLAPLLLGVVVLATTYAAVRGIVGPSFNEQAFAEMRTFHTEFGELGRNVGSFTAPVSLVSFLVPVAILCLALGFLPSAYGWIAWAVFALAMIGIIASYVRTGLLAVVAGAAILAGLVLLAREGSRDRKVYAVALVLLVLGGGYAATLVAGEVAPEARERAQSLANPFSDESVEDRLNTWGDSLKQVAHEPLGTGLGTVGRASLRGRRATTTDSSYLKVLREQGVPGAMLFLAGLGGIVAALAVRLRRLGITRRPLGTAAFAGFGGFLVLMLTGEYIEQPGKLLAWTLLGVAMWECVGRTRERPAPSVPPHELVPLARSAVERARRLPRPALALLAVCALGAGLLSAGIAATREGEYRSTSWLVLSQAGVPDPEQAVLVAAGFLENYVHAEEFQREVAQEIDFFPASNMGGRVRLTTLPSGQRWEFRLTAIGRTAAEARQIARRASGSLKGLRAIHRGRRSELERARVRRQLRAGDLSRARRSILRRRLRVLVRHGVKPAARLTVATRPPRSDHPVDRLADAVAAEASPAPRLGWAGVAGLIFGLAAVVSVLLFAARDRRPG
jgi:O-antigen ligase